MREPPLDQRVTGLKSITFSGRRMTRRQIAGIQDGNGARSAKSCARPAEVRDGVLADGKTGPRKVHLNPPARAVLDRQPRGGRACVPRAARSRPRPRGGTLNLWLRVRREAGVADARLHDLRHCLVHEIGATATPPGPS